VSNLCWKLAAVLTGQAGPALLDSYELERLPVAARNVEHSLRNAGRHGPVAAALGLHPGISADDGWAQIRIWASDTPEGERRRAAAAVAVAANAEDFSQLNIEAGFAYEAGAVIPDGTPRPAGYGTATHFEPTARPGHHVPHVWLNRDGARVSTSDLVAPVGLTLFVDAAHVSMWEAAAAESGHRVTVVAVGGELADPAGEWAAIRGTGTTGALLVRPDRHVAWRLPAGPESTAQALKSALDRILFGPPAPANATVEALLAGIVEAGEAIRRTKSREPALFTVRD
jgi:2,4-dichlorophenol 6-monooxygenase